MVTTEIVDATTAAAVEPAASPAPAPAPAVRVCLFGLSGATFAVEVRHAREIVDVEDLTPVPLAPPALRGVTNLRGYILPVLDARPLLGLRAQPITRGSRVLVLAGPAGPVGIGIDAALALESFDQVGPLGEPARRQLGELGLGVLARGTEPVTLLDAPRVVDALQAGGTGERGERA
jgi:purine-binding chemotaxis protein CheW